jgi:hypothetical protein
MTTPGGKKVDGDPRAPSNGEAPENAPGGRRPPIDEEVTGLPWFRSWRAVYAFVLGVLVLWIGLLALLTAKFS